MTNQNLVLVAGQNQNQKQTGGNREQDSGDGLRMAGGADPLTGAGDRPASGYPEHNPRPEQHQTGGGVDQDEVGDDLKGEDWEGDDQDGPGGYQKNPGFDQPQTGDEVDPDGAGTKLIAGFVREQGGRGRRGKDSGI